MKKRLSFFFKRKINYSKGLMKINLSPVQKMYFDADYMQKILLLHFFSRKITFASFLFYSLYVAYIFNLKALCSEKYFCRRNLRGLVFEEIFLKAFGIILTSKG